MDSVLLPPEPDSPTEARLFTRRLLRSWRVAPSVIEDAELLVTEVVTNSVIHARTPVNVVISRAAGEIRFAVSDRGPGGIEMRAPAPRASTGRGMFLVDRLASGWSAARDAGGSTTVRFALPLVLGEKSRGLAGAG